MTGGGAMSQVRNGIGEPIRKGQIVDRLDSRKKGGLVHVVSADPDRRRHPVLVRWGNFDDEWCHPELLMPREFNKE
jgi:hypothetical protein